MIFQPWPKGEFLLSQSCTGEGATRPRRLQDNDDNNIPSSVVCRFQECVKYMSSERISTFLDAAIRNRIAVRLIAEQHIVLSHAVQNPEQANSDDVGIVDRALSPAKMIRMCGSFVSELCEATLGAAPSIVIDGETDATFACVPISHFPSSHLPLTSLPNSLITNEKDMSQSTWNIS